MKLRPYQTRAAEAVIAAWWEHDSALVVMPTGCGKTVLFADIIRRVFPRKCLVIAHREELIFQAQHKIEAVTGLHAEIEMGAYRANTSGLFGTAQVVVSSIQTLTAGGDGSGRMTRFDPSLFGAVIIDEAHHACADTYRRVLRYFRTNAGVRVLGVTATPDRADELALGQVFQTVAFDYEILDAIRDGWLVPVQQQVVAVEDLDFSNMRTTAGDLNGADLARVMESEKVLHEIAGPSLDIIGDRRALAFTSSVRHAEALTEIFNRHRQGMAAFVCGKTPKEERRQLLADFAAGKYQVMCNCGVLTEGFDDPGVEVVIMGRPTKSRALYAQMIGRATRPLPGVVDEADDSPEHRRQSIAQSGKGSCLVVDFAGNAGRHKLVSTADILGGRETDEVIARAARKARETGRAENTEDLIEQAKAELDAEREKEAARRARLKARTRYSTSAINPFDVFAISPPRVSAPSDRQLSEKQRATLEKQGIDPDRMDYREAKALLAEIFRRWNNDLCSYKQAKLLKKYGLPADVTRAEASSLIDRLARNNWQPISHGQTAMATS